MKIQITIDTDEIQKRNELFISELVKMLKVIVESKNVENLLQLKDELSRLFKDDWYLLSGILNITDKSVSCRVISANEEVLTEVCAKNYGTYHKCKGKK